MTDSTTFANTLALAEHIVGIFALMPKGNGDDGIDTKRRNAMH